MSIESPEQSSSEISEIDLGKQKRIDEANAEIVELKQQKENIERLMKEMHENHRKIVRELSLTKDDAMKAKLNEELDKMGEESNFLLLQHNVSKCHIEIAELRKKSILVGF